MEDIFISIIINSYKRREYIKEAILSVLNQDFDKEKYEIIVVKGFNDDEIDTFLQMNKIINIYVDSIYNGERWVEGIKISKGNLICFMDDDDIFSAKKLSRIYTIYKDNLFDYYHNCYTFDLGTVSKEFSNYMSLETDNTKKNLHKFLKYNIKFKLNINSSSICISRDIIMNYIEESKQVTVGWDVYLFYLYLSHASKFIIDNTCLTYYRQHTSYSHSFENITEFREKEFMRNNDAEGAYILYINIVSQKFLKETLKYEAFSYKIPLYLCEPDYSKALKITSLFLFLLKAKSYSNKFRLVYFSLGILSRLSKDYAFNIYFRLARKRIL